MLNTFPDLLTYSTLAPFILRVVIGLIFLDVGMLKFRNERSRWLASFGALHLKPPAFWLNVYALIQIAGGVLLILGLHAQIAALIFILLTGGELYIEYTDARILKRDIVFYILVLAIAVSILLTGAGAYAFDIPL